MTDVRRQQLEELAENNCSDAILTAYIMRETDLSAEYAERVAENIMDSVDEKIRCFVEEDEDYDRQSY